MASASASESLKTSVRLRLLALLERRKCWAIWFRYRSIGVIYATYRLLAIPRTAGYTLKVSFVTLCDGDMMAAFAKNEAEIADRVSRYLKAELKRADVTYAGLADRLTKHGLKAETVDSIKSKLARGTFSATFLLAALAALELEGVRLEDI
jgi:hypothetical protein